MINSTILCINEIVLGYTGIMILHLIFNYCQNSKLQVDKEIDVPALKREITKMMNYEQDYVEYSDYSDLSYSDRSYSDSDDSSEVYNGEDYRDGIENVKFNVMMVNRILNRSAHTIQRNVRNKIISPV
jgi:hypothetical protein